MVALKAKYEGKIEFIKLSADNLTEICLEYDITAVPTILFFENKKLVKRIDGVNIAEMSIECEKLLMSEKGDALNQQLKNLINSSKIMIFMKGNREQPRCGFSKQLIDIMNKFNVPYGTFDVLSDEKVRQNLKILSDWPTYPQIYVNGELIGGLDIIKELEKNNQLEEVLKC